MMIRMRYWLIMLLVVLTACGGPPNDQAIAPTAQQAVNTVAPTTSAPTDEPLPTTATTTTTPEPVANRVATGRYRIEQQATSTSLDSLVLTVRSATVSDAGLTLRVTFQNTSTETLSLFGGVSGKDAILADASGTEYQPTTVSSPLDTSIEPTGGFSPGAASVGDITFAMPAGSAPYTFSFPSYSSVSIRLDTPLTDEAEASIAPGSYAINSSVRSQRDALRRIELRVSTVDVTARSMTFDIGFANTDQRSGYSLIAGALSGEDARLLDAESVARAPIGVSETLSNTISPADGWLPGQVYTGTLTFPKPERGTEVRFVFPEYDALTITFGAGGVAQAEATSATGGSPAPTATPRPKEQVVAALNNVLSTQAQAVRENNADAYLATLDPALRDAESAVLARLTQVPLISYTLEVAPDASIDETGTEQNSVPVELRYAMRGIDPNNTFTHELRYSFRKNGQSWLVTTIEHRDTPPFWLTGDLVLRETPHFLLFARPDAQANLDQLANETEQAYTTLEGKNLPLESRYIAYFASDERDFATLTGSNASSTLGVALARFELQGSQIVARNRAFSINGAAFTETGQLGEQERQTTITHELVHLAFSNESRPFTPPWLAEGAAVYYADQLTPETRSTLLQDNTLDSLDLATLTQARQLGEHDILGTRVGAEYGFSGEAFAYIVRTFGEAKALELYRSYTEVSGVEVYRQLPVFGIGNDAALSQISVSTTEAAVQRILGISLAQLDSDVKAAIRAG